MKILIGMCSGGVIQAQTAVSLVGALDKLKEYGDVEYELAVQIGGDKTQNMNRLVKTLLEGNHGYLMSIDADMVFPSDGITRLLDNDKDIVGANYAVRGNAVNGHPREAVVKVADANGDKVSMPITALPKTLFQCHALGNGFTLYKRRVFEAAPKPAFITIEDEDGEWCGEDVLFHQAAGKNGFEVWCNPNIKVGHIGTYQYEL